MTIVVIGALRVNEYQQCVFMKKLGEAKVSGILCHRGAQLILAYSWARPAVFC